jgi:hypothetical protein
MYDFLLALALSLPAPWYPPGQNPETPEQYRSRVVAITLAITDSTGGDRDLAVATLIKVYSESRFRVDVHAGKTRGDHGKAICLGQVHRKRTVSVEQWEGLAGTDYWATLRCMTEVSKQLRGFKGWCGSWEAAFSAYATGRGCTIASIGRGRAAMMQKLLRTPPRSKPWQPSTPLGMRGPSTSAMQLN